MDGLQFPSMNVMAFMQDYDKRWFDENESNFDFEPYENVEISNEMGSIAQNSQNNQGLLIQQNNQTTAEMENAGRIRPYTNPIHTEHNYEEIGTIDSTTFQSNAFMKELGGTSQDIGFAERNAEFPHKSKQEMNYDSILGIPYHQMGGQEETLGSYMAVNGEQTEVTLSILGIGEDIHAGNKILIEINSEKMAAVLDSGSPYSLLHKKLLYTIPDLSKCELLDSNIPSLFGAGGSQLRILGRIQVNVMFANRKCLVNFHVVSSLTTPILLGNDFLSDYSIVMDYSEHRAHIPSFYKVISLQDIMIPPESQMTIKAEIESENNHFGFGMLKLFDFIRKCFLGNKNVFCHVQDSQMRVTIHNKDKKMMFLQKNDMIGRLRFIECDTMMCDYDDNQDPITFQGNYAAFRKLMDTSTHLIDGRQIECPKPSDAIYYIDYLPELEPIQEEEEFTEIKAVHYMQDDMRMARSEYIRQNQEPYAVKIHEDLWEYPHEIGHIDPMLTEQEKLEKITALQELVNGIKSDNLGKTTRQEVIDTLMKFNTAISFNETDSSTIRGLRAKLILKSNKIPTCKPMALHPRKKKILDEYIDLMMRKQIVTFSNSGYSHPVFLTLKSSGKGLPPEQLEMKHWRFLSDLRSINALLAQSQYSQITVEQLLLCISMRSCGSEEICMSTADFHNGYQQLKLTKDSRAITAFHSRHGKLEYLVLPQGCISSCSLFCKAVGRVLGNLNSTGVFVYIDDCVLVGPKEDHLKLIHDTLERFSLYNVKVKLSKLKLFQDTITFLEFVITSEKIMACPKKTEIIARIPYPRTRTETKKFLGCCQYFRRVIYMYSEAAAPLYQLTRPSCEFKFTDIHKKAVDTIKTRLIESCGNYLPVASRKWIIHSDSSAHTISAVLSQIKYEKNKEILLPVSFDSRVLTDSEKRYCIAFLEIKALYWAIKTYQKYIATSSFIIRCDSKAAISIVKNCDYESLPSKVVRWVSYINSHSFQISYVPSQLNVSDYFTRVSLEKEEEDDSQQGETIAYIAATKQINNNFPSFSYEDLEGQELINLFNQNRKSEVSEMQCDSDMIQNREVLVVTRGMKQRQELEEMKKIGRNDNGETESTIKESELETENEIAREKPTRQLNPTATDRSWEYLQDLVMSFPYEKTNKMTSPLAQKLAHRHKPILRPITEDDAKLLKELKAHQSGFTMDKWVYSQLEDESLKPLIDFLKSGKLPNKTRKIRRLLNMESHYILHEGKLLCRIRKNGQVQLVVPNRYKRTLCTLLHESIFGAHKSATKMYSLARKNYYFVGMFAYMEKHAKSCKSCQEHQSRPQGKYELNPTTMYEGALVHVTLDLVTNLPSSSYAYQEEIYRKFLKDKRASCYRPVKYKHLMVATCQTTNLIIASPLITLHTEEVVHHFIHDVLLQSSGIKTINCDNGSNLISKIQKALYKKLNIRLLNSTVRSPSSQGLCEKANGMILSGLKRYLASKCNKWLSYLPYVVYSLNAAPQYWSSFSAHELRYGQEGIDFMKLNMQNSMTEFTKSQTLGEFLMGWSEARRLSEMQKLEAKRKMKISHDKNLRPYPFYAGDLVYMRVFPKVEKTQQDTKKLKLLGKWSGCYRILQVFPDNKMPLAKLQNIHTGKCLERWIPFRYLKPAHSREPVTVDEELYSWPTSFEVKETITPQQVVNWVEPVRMLDETRNQKELIEFFPFLDSNYNGMDGTEGTNIDKMDQYILVTDNMNESECSSGSPKGQGMNKIHENEVEMQDGSQYVKTASPTIQQNQ